MTNIEKLYHEDTLHKIASQMVHARGMTQVEVSKLVGASPPVISKALNGKMQNSLKVVEIINRVAPDNVKLEGPFFLFSKKSSNGKKERVITDVESVLMALFPLYHEKGLRLYDEKDE